MDKALSVLEELGAIDAGGALTALGRHIVCSSITQLLQPNEPFFIVNASRGLEAS